MSVFDPNKDYNTKSDDQPDLYKTVMEVQRVLAEINQIMQLQDSEKEEEATPTQSYEEDEEIEDEDQYSIYDDIFEEIN